MMLVTREPEEYEGQLLCPCCGNDGTGQRFRTCEHPLTTHWMSCERYRYADDLCAECKHAEI